MKARILAALPLHQLKVHTDINFYIADYKNFNGGEVELLINEPSDIKSVHLSNPNLVSVCFDGFEDNALPISTGICCKQCECVLFPDRCNDDDWVLFVETKYANDLKAAFKKENDYPNGMTNQIIETVNYFRQKGIIEPNKKVHAIVSFPNLVNEFNSTIFRGNLSIEDIFTRHKIIIRGTNSAKIISEKRIVLNAE